MTRSQSTQQFNTSQDEEKKASENADNSYKAAQADIGDYKTQLSKYASENPFTAGGEYETSQKQDIADVSNAQSNSERQALADQAARTGQNVAGANATAEAIAQSNERAAAGQVADANQKRIEQEAGYNQGVLGATAAPVGMDTTLSGQQLGAEQGAANSSNAASEANKSFMDSFGTSFADQLGKAAGGSNFSFTKGM